MIPRFDNLSTADLEARHREAMIEHRAVRDALIARLKAECPVRPGHIYKIKSGRFKGRTMLVVYIVAIDSYAIDSHPSIRCEGPLNRTATANPIDGFNSRYQRAYAKDFDLESCQPSDLRKGQRSTELE